MVTRTLFIHLMCCLLGRLFLLARIDVSRFGKMGSVYRLLRCLLSRYGVFPLNRTVISSVEAATVKSGSSHAKSHATQVTPTSQNSKKKSLVPPFHKNP